MMPSPRDDKEGYEHNADSLDFGSNGASKDDNDSKANGPSALSALAREEASCVQRLTPGWRRVGCFDRNTVTFASDVKGGSVITVVDDSRDLAMGAEDERKGEMTAVEEEDAGRSIGYFAMTDGGPTSSWDVDEGESPYRLAFYEVAEVGDLAVEKEDESLTNHSHTEHNADFSDVGGNSASEDKNDSKATGPSASSAFAKDEASYVPTSTPGLRCVDSIDNKTVTFASDTKEGSIITADYKSGDLAMGAEDKRKEETTAAVEENAGRRIGYFAMTDGGLLSSWDVDKDESPYRLAFMK
jgi:hypothetical protein